MSKVPTGDLELIGRISTASNATFLGRIGDVEVVYKPIAGERPLWDFPDGSLANREIAAHAVSESLGWGIVPPTWLRDGPFGPGMVQVWQDIPDDAGASVTLTSVSKPPGAGWCHVLDGLDGDERPVSLWHEDSVVLRRMAVFDVVINNADRKGGHVLPMAESHRFGVDHGLTFHTEHKLRTILWGWSGEPLAEDEHLGVERLLAAAHETLGEVLAALLEPDEVAAFVQRCETLLETDRFPDPEPGYPTIPWPPL